MKSVLVTGGAGFIGSHIIEELIERKYNVIVVDNLASGNRKNVPDGIKFIQSDVANREAVEKVFSENKIDVVFHLAGQPSIVNSFSDPTKDVNTNFIGTINTILFTVKFEIPRFIFASSMTVYGNPKTIPITEEEPVAPINYYAVAKYAAERFAHITAQRVDLTSPINITSLRMFNVYGPRQSLTNPYQGVMAIFIGNVLRNETINIYGDGKQSRDFVYVKDVAKVWVDSIDNEQSYGKVFNIGYGRKTSITTLAETVVRAFGKDSSYPIKYNPKRSGDQRDIEADITLAKNILGFNPQHSLEEGLTETLSWAKKQV